MAEEQKVGKRVHPSRVHPLAQDVTEWSVVVEKGVTLEDLLDPTFWTHTSQIKFRTDDLLHVRCDDGSFYGKFYVRSADSKSARVVKLEFYQFDAIENADGEIGLKVEYGGPHHRWRVVRVADGAVLAHGLKNKEDALAWQAGNLKSLAA